MEKRQEPQRIIGRKNRNPQKVSERKQKDEVKASHFFLPDRLLNLKSGGPKEKVPKILLEVLKPPVQLPLLGCSFS
jgi:hypothetical protein